jgi:DNA-3-methyladenine glycosylase
MLFDEMMALKLDFFNRNTLTVAKELLGKKLVRRFEGRTLSGLIAETEAYLGGDDSASHAFRGRTARNSILFGPAGRAYIYFVYGMHYMLNIVTEAEGVPCAVLLRAIKPLDGIELMETLRRKRGKDLTNGPGKLCRAMAIDKSLNGWDLTCGDKLWLENHRSLPATAICAGPRIGIDFARAEDRQAFMRFWIRDDNLD